MVPASGNGLYCTHGNIDDPGSVANDVSRLKRPFEIAFSCSPPTQSWFATSAGAPSGMSATAEIRLNTPWPEFCVSQVVSSGGMSSTLATDFCPRSTTLTCASRLGSAVMDCVMDGVAPFDETAIARAAGHGNLKRAMMLSARASTTAVVVLERGATVTQPEPGA